MEPQRLRTIEEITGDPNILQESLKLSSRLVLEGRKLPNADELQFHTVSTSLGGLLRTSNKLITKQLMLLTRYINPKGGEIKKRADSKIVFTKVIDYLDDLCENVDISIDKMRMSHSNAPKMVIRNQYLRDIRSQDQLTKGNDNLKPQNFFTEKIDNSELPFIPKIKLKHHAKIPLNKEVLKASKDPESYFKIFKDKGENLHEYEFGHPYEHEIDNLVVEKKFLSLNFEGNNPGKETPNNFAFVDTWASLKLMMTHLRSKNEIAVDLEHHSYRSFLGFTCLIQISTREQDYVLDAIALRDHLHMLNEIFSDPSKLKVFHGANKDMVWLQRDFGVYVVNLFDTHHAVKLLGKPPFSFASLLFRYTKQVSDKALQLADWRIRPLTKEMMKYARRDTHYLLYIYDCLKIDLINKAKAKGSDPEEMLLQVWNKSRTVSLLQYRKPIRFDRKYYDLYNYQKPLFTDFKMKVFRSLWSWRYDYSRKFDESRNYILPNNILGKIAMKVPRTVEQFFKIKTNLPKKTKELAKEIISVVLKAERELGAVFARQTKSVIRKVMKKAKPNNQHLASIRSKFLLKEDSNIDKLIIKFSKLKIKELKHCNNAASVSSFLLQKSGTCDKSEEQTNDLFNYGSEFGYLNELYPGMADKIDFKNKLQASAEETSTYNNLLKVQTQDYMEFGKEAGDKTVSQAQNLDIEKMLSIPSLPKSLRDKFGLELMKKRFNSNKSKKKKKQKKVKMAKLQQQDLTLLKGNMFDVLRKKEPKEKEQNMISIDPPTASAFNENPKDNSFWEKMKEMDEKMKQAKKKKKKQQLKFGPYRDHHAKKQIQKKRSKFGRGKQDKFIV